MVHPHTTWGWKGQRVREHRGVFLEPDQNCGVSSPREVKPRTRLGQHLAGKKVKSLSCIQLFATPWTVACQTPPSMVRRSPGIQGQTHAVGCLSFPEGGSLSPHSANFTSQLMGKPRLGGFSSGAVSPEPGAEVGDPHSQGKAKPHPHIFALQESPVSLSLLGTFLAPTETHSVCEPAYLT